MIIKSNRKKCFYAIIIFQYGEIEIVYEEVTIILYSENIESANDMAQKFIQLELQKSCFPNYKLVEVEIVDDVLFDKKNDIWHVNSRIFLD